MCMVMFAPHLISIELDEHSIFWRNAAMEQERHVAVCDLIEGNYFRPERDHGDGYTGPFRLILSIEESRLVLTINREDGSVFEIIVLGMARFRRPVREYHAIVDSYSQAVRQSSPQMIETIDMARRGVHNDAANLLMERLKGKVELDFNTARRLFTLISVLHIKG